MLKILVIDDSALMRKVSRDHLEEAGFDVDDCMPASAEELVERIQRVPPDLVLSDFHMPGIDGMHVARTLRQLRPELPVIILTANRDPARDALLKTLGVRKILHKPIDGESLITAISDVLAGP